MLLLPLNLCRHGPVIKICFFNRKMATKQFEKHFLNYTSQDPAILCSSISALDFMVDSANPNIRLSTFSKLEEMANKIKDQGIIPGLSKAQGWTPLYKLLKEMVRSGNPAHQERAFAVMVQLFALSRTEGFLDLGSDLVQMISDIIGIGIGDKEKEKAPMEVREAALHALKVLLLDKFLNMMPSSISKKFPELQSALLSILPDKSSEPIRVMAAECMGQIVAYHTNPSSLFSILSDMSADCELRLKDDPLLDDLLDKTMGRENEMREYSKHNKINLDSSVEY